MKPVEARCLQVQEEHRDQKYYPRRGEWAEVSMSCARASANRSNRDAPMRTMTVSSFVAVGMAIFSSIFLLFSCSSLLFRQIFQVSRVFSEGSCIYTAPLYRDLQAPGTRWLS